MSSTAVLLHSILLFSSAYFAFAIYIQFCTKKPKQLFK